MNAKVYTPEEVAAILQLSKNTVYSLISRGEIIAKKIGNVYRIPKRSIAFVFTGLDDDLSDAEAEDMKNLANVRTVLRQTRTSLV